MRPMKVAIQGIAASFHAKAANHYIKEDYDMIECETFTSVCESLSANRADYALMAIENSMAGSILTNYTLIKQHRLNIIGEIYLPVSFHLMANKGTTLENLESIVSHPMALAQCSVFLSRHPFIKTLAGHDTASCAKKIKVENLKNTGAIASAEAASLYGLEVLKSHIEDHQNHYTRFLILSKQDPKVQNADKSTISFELQHELGQLADVLDVLKCHRLNATKIQSVPALEKISNYAFFMDIEWGSLRDHERALRELSGMIPNLRLLGTYKKHRIHSQEPNLLLS